MPNQVKQFKNPPIKEAIFAISFKEAIPHEQLVAFAKNEVIKKTFPIYQPGIVVEFSNKPKQGEEANSKQMFSSEQKQEGYLLRGEKGHNRIIQVKPTVISYHNFNQYAGWDVMYEELQNIWSEFCKSVSQTRIKQISVRYINNILIPLPLKEKLSEYIKLLPQIPQGISPKLNNFFLQVKVRSEDGAFQGAITETILPKDKKQEAMPILLDINVVQLKEYNHDSQEVWKAFSEIRKFKNQLFLSCITAETEKLFN